MKKLLCILLIFSFLSVLGDYESQYLKVCTTNPLIGNSKLRKLDDASAQVRTICKDRVKLREKLASAPTELKNKINQLTIKLNNFLNAKEFIQQLKNLDSKKYILENVYIKEIKNLINTTLSHKTDTKKWTKDTIFNFIKNDIKEIRALQFDANFGSEIIKFCERPSPYISSFENWSANSLCGKPLQEF